LAQNQRFSMLISVLKIGRWEGLRELQVIFCKLVIVLLVAVPKRY
jgi:hypothetical protein